VRVCVCVFGLYVWVSWPTLLCRDYAVLMLLLNCFLWSYSCVYSWSRLMLKSLLNSKSLSWNFNI